MRPMCITSVLMCSGNRSCYSLNGVQPTTYVDELPMGSVTGSFNSLRLCFYAGCRRKLVRTFCSLSLCGIGRPPCLLLHHRKNDPVRQKRCYPYLTYFQLGLRKLRTIQRKGKTVKTSN